MKRYTSKALQHDVDYFNVRLESYGSLKRIECGHRNGYNAADEYSVDDKGIRIGSGVDRMIAGGAPRYVYTACKERFWQLINELKDAKIQLLENRLSDTE